MRKPLYFFSLIVMTAMLLSACGAPASTPEMMQDITTPDAMMPAATPETMMEPPAWFSATLTDVRNADTFTIHDFEGKVVLVETMAMSCSDCRAQQNEIQALHEQLGMQDDFVSVSLDVDPNDNADALISYLDGTSFDWLYAVASEDVSRDIASLYGDQFLDPASTPILIIDRHGVVHTLPFGLKKVDDLLQAVNMYLNEGM